MNGDYIAYSIEEVMTIEFHATPPAVEVRDAAEIVLPP